VNDLPSLDRPEPTPPKIRVLVMLEGEERLVLRRRQPTDRLSRRSRLNRPLWFRRLGSP
jgi:hypothetical protein